MSEYVPMRKPDGSLVKVAKEDVETAKSRGYSERELTEKEKRLTAAEERPLAALAERATAEILPFGIGEKMNIRLAEMAGETREDVQARAEANPFAAGVGTALGVVASPLGKVAGAVKGAGLAVKAARGALGGGLFGLSSHINESVLGDTELNGQKLAADAMSSMGAGMAADVFLHGAGKVLTGVGKAVSPALKRLAPQGLAEFAERESAKAAVGAKKLAPDEMGFAKEVADYAKEKGIISQFSSPESVLDLAHKNRERLSQGYDELLSGLDAAAPVNAPALRKALQQLRDEYRFRPKLLDAAEAMGADFERMATQQGVTWRDVFQHARDISPAASLLTDAQLSKDARKLALKGREAILDVIADESEKAGLRQLRPLSAEYAKAVAVVDGAEAAVEKMTNASLFSPMKWAQARAPYALPSALERAAPVVEKVKDSIYKSMQKVLAIGDSPEVLGPYYSVLANAVSKGPDATIDAHALLARTHGDDYLSRVGMSNESPELMASKSRALAGINAVSQANANFDVAMGEAIEGIVKGGSKAEKRFAVDKKTFEQQIAALKQLKSGAEDVFAGTDGDVRFGAPGTVAMAAGTLSRGADFLLSRAPRNPYENSPPATRPVWEPSRADMEKFNRYVEAVVSPVSVLRNLSRGLVMKEQIEALRAVYPAIYEDLRVKMSERLATVKNVPYRQRLAIQALVGGDARVTMDKRQQQVLQMATTPQKVEGAGIDGRQVVSQEKNMETQGQRMEAR